MLEKGIFTAELNGFRIGYEIRGAGPVLMTVPNSWGLTRQGLMGLYKPLEKHFTMIYFDPRGMGESGPIERQSDMGLAAVREDFDALRRHLGLTRVCAVGWSNGALNLILLASERPETLAAAIFVHGLARFTEEESRGLQRSHGPLIERFRGFIGEQESQDLPQGEADARFKRFYVEEYFPACCADPESARPMLEEVFREAAFSYAHTRHSFSEMPSFDFRDRLWRITVPCLVVAGAHDLLPPPSVEEMARGIRGARFLVFEKSGHFAPAEEEQAFVRAVREFLTPALPEAAEEILRLERGALERWGRGDPSGFLEISDDGVVYFDPFLERRIDGLEALKEYYEGIRGQVFMDRFELLNPRVQACGDSAVLTFNYVSWTGGRESRWNCTEVYRRAEEGWRIIQTHWSKTMAGR